MWQASSLPPDISALRMLQNAAVRVGCSESWGRGGGDVTPVFNLENAQVLQQKRGKSGQSSLLANPVCVNTRREWKCCTLSPVINSREKWVISFSAGEQ